MYLEYTDKSIVFNGEVLFATKYTKDVGIRRAGDFGPYAAKDVVFNDKSPCTFDQATKILSGGSKIEGNAIIFNSVISGGSAIRGNFIIENSSVCNASLVRVGKSVDFATIKDSTIVSSVKNVPLGIYCSSSVWFDIFNSHLLLDVETTECCINATGTCTSLSIYNSNINFQTGTIILKDYAKFKIEKSSLFFPNIIAKRPCNIDVEKSESKRFWISGTSLKMSSSKFEGVICSKGNGSKGTHVKIENSCVKIKNYMEIESENVNVDILSSTIDEILSIKILNKSVRSYSLLIDKSKISGNISLVGGSFGVTNIVESNLSGRNLIIDSILSGCNVTSNDSRIVYSNLHSCDITKMNSIGTDFLGKETMSIIKTAVSDLVFDEPFCFFVFPFAKSAALIKFKNKMFLVKNGSFKDGPIEDLFEQEVTVYKKKDIFPLNSNTEWALIAEYSVAKIFECLNRSSRSDEFKEILKCSVYSSILSLLNAYHRNKNFEEKDLVEQKMLSFCVLDILQKRISKLSQESIFVPKWLLDKSRPYSFAYFYEDSAKQLEKFIVVPQIY